MKCLICSVETNNPRFCSRSCSAKFNNCGKQRHGKPCHPCSFCGSPTRRKYCSTTCSGAARRVSKEQQNITNSIRQSRYRAKKYRVLDPSADKEKIKNIYKNCPPGYEVDHIIALSNGGKHHEDNLQYLTISENRKKSNRY